MYRLVKAPLGLLWFGGPSNDEILPRHGHGPSPQVAGGRLVIEGPDMLRCVDVYTGRVMWQRSLPGLGKYYNTTRHFPGAGEIGPSSVLASCDQVDASSVSVAWMTSASMFSRPECRMSFPCAMKITYSQMFLA